MKTMNGGVYKGHCNRINRYACILRETRQQPSLNAHVLLVNATNVQV